MTFTAWFLSLEDPTLHQHDSGAQFDIGKGLKVTIYADDETAALELAFLNAPAGHRLHSLTREES